jgi:hypothetical protein
MEAEVAAQGVGAMRENRIETGILTGVVRNFVRRNTV